MLITKPYMRERAVEYARRWALSRNPLFADFTGIGGNCTSFVSQCVLAGGLVMNFTPDFGWYYISLDERAPAWSGVDFFYRFLVGESGYLEENGGVGPYGREVGREEIEAGDVIQLKNRAGDWYHSLLVSEVREDEILVCAHSNDALDRPLSAYRYEEARFLHVAGVCVDTEEVRAYAFLLDGGNRNLREGG